MKKMYYFRKPFMLVLYQKTSENWKGPNLDLKCTSEYLQKFNI